jgi:hypothetical protein
VTAPSNLPSRGGAGPIDPADPAPFDAAAYHHALAQVERHLTACIAALDTVTPPEPDLRHLSDLLTAAREAIIRPRRGRVAQCTFEFLDAQTSPRD